MTIKRTCLHATAAAITILGAVMAQGQIPEPLKGGERILWVGNSLKDPSVNGSKALIQAAFPGIDYTVVHKGKGSGVYREYWEGVEAAAGTVEKIKEGNWAIVVLQGHMDVVNNPDDFIKYGTLLAEEAKKVGAKVVFLWPQPDAWKFDDAYASGKVNYPKLAAATGGFVAPCIEAWKSAATRYPATQWQCPPNPNPLANDVVNAFYKDCIHATGNGNLLNATVMYTILTGGKKSPVGLRPPDLTNLVGPYDPAKLDVILEIGYKVGLEALGQGTTQSNAGITVGAEGGNIRPSADR